MRPTFEIDKTGLAKILSRRGIEYTLTVQDDNPHGFADLSHALAAATGLGRSVSSSWSRHD